MKLLVAGGAGFIGSTLVDRLLAEGHDVDVVDDLSTGAMANLAEARAEASGRLKIHHADLTTTDAVDLIARRAPEVIVHLASPAAPGGAVDSPVADALGVLGTTANLLGGARRAGTRKIIAVFSATDLYADCDERPTIEASAPGLRTPAGIHRAAAIEHLRVARRLDGIEHTVLAVASVYGPRQRADGEGGVVRAFVDACQHGSPFPIEGDGSQRRDFVYVDDVVDAITKAIGRGDGLTINVGSGVAVSLRDLATLVAALYGTDVAVEQRPSRPRSVQHCHLDIARARIQLGWAPWTELPTGLRQLAQTI